MTLILDTGGVSALAGQQARLAALRRRGLMPPMLPTPVLTECLTGDHRRDYHVNRVLQACVVVPVDELLAREAARLRTATGRARSISAVDALVVALAVTAPDPIILTSDPKDMAALADHAARPITVVSA